MTRQLLAEGKRWLVIFPEGHAIWQNSILAPFQQGVIQLAFKAYEDATAADANAHLFCVPIAIKYIYLKDMHDGDRCVAPAAGSRAWDSGGGNGAVTLRTSASHRRGGAGSE